MRSPDWMANFRRAVLANPDLTSRELGERFGLASHDVNRWCRKLGMPQPPSQDGLSKLARPNYGARRAR